MLRGSEFAGGIKKVAHKSVPAASQTLFADTRLAASCLIRMLASRSVGQDSSSGHAAILPSTSTMIPLAQITPGFSSPGGGAHLLIVSFIDPEYDSPYTYGILR